MENSEAEKKIGYLKFLVGEELNQVNKQTKKIEKIGFEDWYKKFKPGVADDHKFVALYFGSHWAPPSRVFTEILDSEFYQKVNKDGLVCEVIFVSDDRTEEAYNHNLINGSTRKKSAEEMKKGEDDDDEEDSPMPWVAMTWENKEKMNNLKLRYIVKTQPSLVVVIWEFPNEEGKEGIRLIECDARNDIKNPDEALKKWAHEVVEPWRDDPDKFKKYDEEQKAKKEAEAAAAEEQKNQ